MTHDQKLDQLYLCFCDDKKSGSAAASDELVNSTVTQIKCDQIKYSKWAVPV